MKQRTLFPPRTSPSQPLRIRELPQSEQPRSRLRDSGPQALSDAELLALLIQADTLTLCQCLITTFANWHGLCRASLNDLQQTAGIGLARACQIKAALEVARRLALASTGERQQIKAPSDVVQLLQLEMGHLDHEQLRTVLLDTKNRIQAITTVYVGSLNTALIRVGEVYKEAVRRNSAALILVHNHPSQDPTPSPEDVLVTRQIIDAGQLLDIELLDHVIVCASSWVSLRERGLGFAR